MKQKIHYFTLLLSFFSLSCAFGNEWPKLAKQLEGTWSGPWIDGESYGDLMSFDLSPSYTETIYRQVGSDDSPSVPYATNCLFTRYAVAVIDKCTQEQLAVGGFCNLEGNKSDYILSFQLQYIELVESDLNDKACDSFVELESQFIGELYSHPFSLNSAGEIVLYGSEVFRKL